MQTVRVKCRPLGLVAKDAKPTKSLKVDTLGVGKQGAENITLYLQRNLRRRRWRQEICIIALITEPAQNASAPASRVQEVNKSQLVSITGSTNTPSSVCEFGGWRTQC